MALDIVEMFLAVEERFGISIPDDEAQQATTAGKLLDVVMAKLTVSHDPACLTQRAFHLLRSSAIATYGIARSQVKLHVDLNDVFPYEGRQASWAKFRHNVGALEWPELIREKRLLVVLTGCSLGTLVLAGYFSVAAGWSGPIVFLSSILAATAVAWWGARATRTHKRAIPSECATVARLAQYIVAHNPRLVTRERNTWTRERAWCVLREIVIEWTSVQDLDENSSFVDDLNLG